MRWLERYLLLERVMMDLDDEGEHHLGDLVRDALDSIWSNLDRTDISYLKGRGMLAVATDLDKVKPPAHVDVTWWSLPAMKAAEPNSVVADWYKILGSRYWAARTGEEWSSHLLSLTKQYQGESPTRSDELRLSQLKFQALVESYVKSRLVSQVKLSKHRHIFTPEAKLDGFSNLSEESEIFTQVRPNFDQANLKHNTWNNMPVEAVNG